jgi:hypothetical protein
LLRHGDVLDGGYVKGHWATVDGKEDSFLLHVHLQLSEWSDGRGVGEGVGRREGRREANRMRIRGEVRIDGKAWD